jgi:hypothetical protein
MQEHRQLLVCRCFAERTWLGTVGIETGWCRSTLSCIVRCWLRRGLQLWRLRADQTKEVQGRQRCTPYIKRPLKIFHQEDTRTTYGITSFKLSWCFLPSSELSHSIFSTAISQVSRTLRSESWRYSFRIGIEDGSEIAPIASAA